MNAPSRPCERCSHAPELHDGGEDCRRCACPAYVYIAGQSSIPLPGEGA